MAEFCLACWNKIMNTTDPPGKYLISREPDFCEECGAWKPVIIRIRRSYVAAEWLRKKLHNVTKTVRK